MLDSWDSLVRRYRHKGILVDSNPLIGLLVGRFNPAHLHNCRATKGFTEEDYELLERVVARFDQVVTTPHILTEVSNLGGKLPEGLVTDFRVVFREVIKNLSEQPLAAKVIAQDSHFLRFGLTDTSITLIAPGSYLVLTGELDLYGLLLKRKVDVINFNHLRVFGWT